MQINCPLHGITPAITFFAPDYRMDECFRCFIDVVVDLIRKHRETAMERADAVSKEAFGNLDRIEHEDDDGE